MSLRQLIFRFIYRSSPAAGVTESRTRAAAMHFIVLWSTGLLSSNETASICCKSGCATPAAVAPAGALASLPGNQIPRGVSHDVEGLGGSRSVLQGWVPPALQSPSLAPFRKRSPRWALRTTVGLTIFALDANASMSSVTATRSARKGQSSRGERFSG